MKTAEKLAVAVILFCFAGTQVVSANTIGYHDREAKWQNVSTDKPDAGIDSKDRIGKTKVETKDKQWTVAQTKKPYTRGDKGFGVASGADPKVDARALKSDITKVKLIDGDASSKPSVRALDKAEVGREKKTAKMMFKENLEAVTTQDLKASIWQPTFFELKDTKDKADKFKVGKPETEIAFTKKTDEKEKNAKPT